MQEILKRLVILLILAVTISSGTAAAQGSIPPPPEPPRLVNDFAGILQPSQVDELERRLVAFSDTTTTQIVVVTISSLGGYDISDFTQRLGQSWGVGSRKYNNGCVILVKPKTDTEKGEADIESGYGLEHLITDGDAWNIVNKVMIPYFRQNDYYGGITAGVDAVIGYTTGAYKSDSTGNGMNGTPVIVIIIIIIVIIFIISKFNRNNHHTIGRNTGMGPIFWPGSSGGHWGGFGGGGGGFGGGGGGGFGGFGGGSFGGGGASGSW